MLPENPYARKKFLFIINKRAMIIIAAGIISFIVWRVALASETFANFIFNLISYNLKRALTGLTYSLPFSFAELVLLMLFPVCALLLYKFVRKLIVSNGMKAKLLYLAGAGIKLLCTASVCMFIFTFTFGVSYGTTPVEKRMGFARRPLSADDLYNAMTILRDKANGEAKNISFVYNATGSTVMPYNINVLNKKLQDAYNAFLKDYNIYKYIHPKVKPVILSVQMSKIHTTGIYTFFTGEANINIDFPDYSIPYTAAHEMSHLLGVAREDEANFVAFMICTYSDDSYIRYSGYVNMYEYFANALYSADKDRYMEIAGGTEGIIIQEMRAYNAFFEKYREEEIAKVTNKVYDSYLKAQGQDQGSKSYGLVIDLAAVYLLK